MRYLAGVSYPDLPAQALADVLVGMEHVDARQASIRCRAGRAFTGHPGLHIDWAQKTLGAWYKNITKVYQARRQAHKAWTRRLAEHPLIIDALAETGVISRRSRPGMVIALDRETPGRVRAAGR